MRAWLSEWHNEAVTQRENIRPSDWIAMALTMIEILVDMQGLKPEEKEKVAFGLMAEVQKRISSSSEDAWSPH